jgi:hypothetical protein
VSAETLLRLDIRSSKPIRATNPSKYYDYRLMTRRREAAKVRAVEGRMLKAGGVAEAPACKETR